LNALADWGVTGTVIVASAFAVLLWGAGKTWMRVRRSDSVLAGRPTSNKSAFVLGAVLGVVAMLVHATVDFNMQIPANAILAVSLMALLTGFLRFTSDCYWVTVRLGLKRALTLLLAAALGYLGWQGWRKANEFAWLHRAERLQSAPPVSLPDMASMLTKAFAAEPKNAETAWAIGEAYRIESWEGGENYADLSASALKWFDLGRQLNPFDGYCYLRCGMCLDWVGKHEEAEPYFRQADALDPNGYFTAAWIGWHYVQVMDYAAAKTWFERSLRLQWKDNTIAAQYLPIVTRRLLEGAVGATLQPEAPKSH
jgi:tetratricopeptide (TPR) repeat protein